MNKYCRETINRVGAGVEESRVGTLASPVSGPHPNSDRVGAGVEVGRVGTLASPTLQVHESDMTFSLTMGGPRAPTTHPRHPRPYADRGHYCYNLFAFPILLAF